MPAKRSVGTAPRREHFRCILRSIHWQAEKPTCGYCPSRCLEDGAEEAWSRMPNWSSNVSRAKARPGRNLCAATRTAYSTFATWATSVTRNLLIDHYRRTKRDRITDSLDDKMPVVENKESAGRRPDEQVLLGELSGQVQSALTRLSPELREAVILRDLQQLEY